MNSGRNISKSSDDAYVRFSARVRPERFQRVPISHALRRFHRLGNGHQIATSPSKSYPFRRKASGNRD